MRSCDLSLKSVASGIGRWGSCCELSGRLHFPPTEEAVLAWSAYNAAGRTFRMYLPHPEKACITMGLNLDWKTRAVTQAAKGLARAGGRIHEPKPAVSKSLICQDREPKPDNCPFCSGGAGQLGIPTKGAVSMLTAGTTNASRKNGRRVGFAAPIGDRNGKRYRRRHIAGGSRC